MRCYIAVFTALLPCCVAPGVYVSVHVDPGWVGKDGSVYSEHERLTPRQPIKEENAQEKGKD